MNNEPYSYIKAWGKILGSNPYFIKAQIKLAREDEAPHNAIYKGREGWVTVDEILDIGLRAKIELLVVGL